MFLSVHQMHTLLWGDWEVGVRGWPVGEALTNFF